MSVRGGGKRLAFLLPDMRGGGAERVALRLIEDFVRAGHEVDLVLMSARGELMELLPPQVRVVDLEAARIRNVLLPMRRYFRDRQPDGIQISMWPLTSIGLIAHRLARSRARTVISEHITLSKQYPTSGAAGMALRTSIRLTYPFADARVVVSRQAADDLARISGIGRDTIEVVYNPVSEPPADSAATPEIEALWGDATDRIITVGSLKEQKNHMLLVRAFAALSRRRPQARLMILGEGELRPRLMAMAEEEGVSDKVAMPGFFTNPWPFYASANLFALSSDYEGYPLVLIEAMRSGLSIVSTDCESGPREILADGRFGALVRCGDAAGLAEAMAAALDAPADPLLMMSRAEELSGQDTSDRYLELIAGSA